MEQIYSKFQSDELGLLATQIQLEHNIIQNKSFKKSRFTVITKSLNSDHRRYQIKIYTDIFESKRKAISVLKNILISKLLAKDNNLYILPCKNFHNLAVRSILYQATLKKILGSRFNLSIEHVQFFLYLILLEVNNLHKNNIIHRCINTKNILANTDEDFKLVNFENTIIGDEKRFKLRPSLYEAKFMAPEEFINRKNIGKAADIWSIGIILLELISKKSISTSESEKHFYEVFNTQKEFDEYVVSLFDLYSSMFSNAQTYDLAKDLAFKILRFNPEERITCIEALKHKLFNDIHDDEYIKSVEGKSISCDYTRMKFDELKNFILQEVSSALYKYN